MKKVMMLFAGIIMAYGLSAQVTKGNFLVGGAISFETSKYTESDENVNSFILFPDAGYFFVDRFAAGIRASYTNIGVDGDNYNDFLIGPFARYYFLPAAQRTNIFLEGNFMFGSEKFEGLESESRTQFGFAAGPAFFVNPHVAIEATVHWQSIKIKDDPGRTNNFGIGVGFQIHLDCMNGNKEK